MNGLQDALTHLGDATGDAMVEVLEMVAPGSATRGAVRVLTPAEDPLEGVAAPALATAVDYVDGITGGNLVVLSLAAAHRLAAAMMGGEAEDVTGELDELSGSAISEATNQIMAAAAAAVGTVLEAEIEISPPRAVMCTDDALLADFVAKQARTPHVLRTPVRVCDEPAWIVQHVPAALAVRVETAREAHAAEVVDPVSPAAGAQQPPELGDVHVRVWAELGRTHMPAMTAASLPSGSVVEFDRRPNDPVELFVNGRCLAHGRLVVVDGTDWAFQIDDIVDTVPPETPIQGST